MEGIKNSMTLKEIRARFQNNLKRWNPDNDPRVEQAMRIFDLTMSRRGFLKAGSLAAASALLLPGCGSSSSSSSVSGSGGPLPTEPFTEGVANIVASADCMQGVTTYKKFSTIDASNLESAMEAINPFSMIASNDYSSTGSGFVPLDKSYGHPEIVHLTQNDKNQQIISVNEYTYTHGLGLEETTIPLYKFNSKYDSQVTEYNRIVASNGREHNTRTSAGKVIGQKMILAGVDYNLRFGDKSRDINTWHDYVKEVGDRSELHNQLMLYYQYSETDPIVTSKDIVGANGSDWQSLNLIDDFKNNFSTPPVFPCVKPFSDWCIVVSDLAKYEDGMGNTILYGTIQADYFYSIGFAITFSGNKPKVSWFSPEELSWSAGSDNYAGILLLKQFYGDWQGKGDLDAAFNQNTGMPVEITESNLYHQIYRPITVVDNVHMLFSYATLDTADKGLQINIASATDAHVIMPTNKYFCLSVNLDESDNLTTPSSSSALWNVSAARSPEGTGPCQIGYARGVEPYGDVTDFYLAGITVGNAVFYPRASRKNAKGNTEILGHYFKIVVDDLNAVTRVFELAESPADVGIYAILSVTEKENSIEKSDYRKIWFDTLFSSGAGELSDWINNAQIMKTLKVEVTYNHQGLARFYFLVPITGDPNTPNPYLIGWFEKPDRSELEQYGTVDIFDRFDRDQLAFYTPMPVSCKVDRLLSWNNYLHDGEVVLVGPSQKGVDAQTRRLCREAAAEDESSYFYAIQDQLENSWKFYELQGKVPQPLQEVSAETRVQALLHHIELQATDSLGHPAAMPDGAHVEIRTGDNVQLLDVTEVGATKCVNINRTVSYLATPDSGGRVVLQVDMGHESDFMPGTSLYYRIVNKASLTMDQSRPTMILGASNDGTTTDWRVFNISYAMHARMDADNYSQAQTPGTNSPHDRIGSNFNSKYSSQKDKIEGQFQTGYGQLASASMPDNSTRMTLHGTGASAIDPLTHVLALSSSANSLPGSFWDDINPMHWIKQLAKLAKKVLDEIIDKIKAIIDDILNDLADLLSDLGLDGLANACSKLESAIDAVLDTVKTFVDIVLDIIAGNFDFKAGWEIGQALRKITESMLTADMIASVTKKATAVKTDVSGFFSAIDKDLDKYIDLAFGSSSKANTSIDWNTYNKGTTDMSQNVSANKTHQNYVFNQLQGNIDFGSASANLVALPGPSADLLAFMDKVDADISATLENSLDAMFQIQTDLMSGKLEAMPADLGKLFKTILKDLFNLFDDLFQGIIDLFSETLGVLRDDILHAEVPEAIATLFNIVLKPLFGLTSDLKYWSDLGFFIAGFMINIAGIVFHDVFKTKDLHAITTSQVFSDTVLNGFQNQGRASMRFNDADKDNMATAAVAISLSSAAIEFIGELIADDESSDRLWITVESGAHALKIPAHILNVLLINPRTDTSLDKARKDYILSVTIACAAIFAIQMILGKKYKSESAVAGLLKAILNLVDTVLFIVQVAAGENLEGDEICESSITSMIHVLEAAKWACAKTETKEAEAYLDVAILASLFCEGVLDIAILARE